MLLFLRPVLTHLDCSRSNGRFVRAVKIGGRPGRTGGFSAALTLSKAPYAMRAGVETGGSNSPLRQQFVQSVPRAPCLACNSIIPFGGEVRTERVESPCRGEAGRNDNSDFIRTPQGWLHRL